MRISRKFRSMAKFLKFSSKNNAALTVDSFSKPRNAGYLISVGLTGDFDQVIRIAATHKKSSRIFYHDLVVGSWWGSQGGFADRSERELVALHRTLTASAVANELKKLGYADVTLLFQGEPMPDSIKKEMLKQSKQHRLTPLRFHLA